MVSPKVKHFIFEAEDLPNFSYLPGQFITIHFDYQGKSLKRSYSLANPPLDTKRIEFAAGFVESGPGTDLLFNLTQGEKLLINGPFGRLTLKGEVPKRYIFVATSTGITPYRSMLPELKKRLDANIDLKIIFLLGVQTAEDALYSQEFLEFSLNYPDRVSFRVHLSRANSNLAAHQHKGYVQHAFPELGLEPEADVVYLCGNPAMIDESFEDLKERGFSLQQIIREKYISGR